MTYRERALRVMLAMVMVLTLAIPAVAPAPATAADTDFIGGPLLADTPSLVPNDHTPLALRFNGSGLDPDSTYYVKVRFSLTPTPSGGGALHRGFIWNKDLGEWIRNRGEDWSRFPTVQTNASGNVISTNDANWVFFKFGHEGNSGDYYIIITLNKDGTDGSSRNCDSPLLVKVIDMKTEGAWLHNGTATGATDFRRVTLNAEGATGSTDLVQSIHRTEANLIDDDSNGTVDDEDWGPAGATGDWRLAASAETTVNPHIQQNLQLGGNFKMKFADEDIAFGSADTTAPASPANLDAEVDGTTATLTWDPSADDVGVTAYHVYRWVGVSSVEFTPPHVRIATTTDTTYEDTGLTPGVTYNYEVRAADAATNVSARSNAAMAAIPQLTDIQHHDAGVTFDRFVTGYNSAYSGGGYVYGRWTGTALQARFTGDWIRIIGPKQPNYGKADVYIDGVKVDTVDCYASDADKTLEAVLWETTALTDAPHTIELRLKGEKNIASTGNIVVLDRFEVDGAMPAGGGIRYDEMTGTFAGPWISGANSAYIEKGYRYSRYTNASFTATFDGTKVAWIGPKTGSYGRARVYIDGVQQGSVVSQYGPTGWRYRVWESKTLPAGTHTIKIVPNGTKDAASGSTNIVIDAIDVTP
jgi:hypothetical protein